MFWADNKKHKTKEEDGFVILGAQGVREVSPSTADKIKAYYNNEKIFEAIGAITEIHSLSEYERLHMIHRLALGRER